MCRIRFPHLSLVLFVFISLPIYSLPPLMSENVLYSQRSLFSDEEKSALSYGCTENLLYWDSLGHFFFPLNNRIDLTYIEDSLLLQATLQHNYSPGLFTVEGYDNIINDNVRDIQSESGDLISGINLELQRFRLWGGLHSDIPWGGFSFNTPAFLGFSFSGELKRDYIGSQRIDFVKNYLLDVSVAEDIIEGTLFWENEQIKVHAGYSADQVYLINRSINLENSINLYLEGGSDYYWFGGLSYQGEDDLFVEIKYYETKYRYHLYAGLFGRRFFDITNRSDREKAITLYSRRLEGSLNHNNWDVNFALDYLHLPFHGANQFFLDFDPISPVGLLFRRRDIIDDCETTIFLGAIDINKEISFKRLTLDWTLPLGFLYIGTTGIYHYMEGVLVPPFVNWSWIVYPDEKINLSNSLYYLWPGVSFTFPVNQWELSFEISQFIPIVPVDLNKGDDGTLIETGEEDFDFLKRDLWGGTSISFQFQWNY